VPSQIDNLFVHSILSNLETWVGTTLVFNWQKVVEILPEAHCSILHLRDLLDENGVTLEHEEQNGKPAFAQFTLIFDLNLAEKPIEIDRVYISPVKTESRLAADSEALKKFLKPQLSSQNLDVSAINALFSELYMNICQHAKAKNGYIFATHPDEDGNVTFYFSDPGVGISQNIRQFYRDKEDEPDEKLIEFATQDRISTKSQTQNQGSGLATILSSINEMDGRVETCSLRGCLISESNNKPLKSLSYNHKGTFITLKFNINRLEKLSDDEFNTDIDF